MKGESVARFDASEIIQRHLDNVKNAIITKMAENRRNASMRHVNSLSTEVTMGSGVLWGLQTFNFMETGRSGGKVPRGFRQIIYQWSLDKGIAIDPIPYVRGGEHKYTPEQRGRMAFAGAVAYSIMKNGTSLYRSGVREDIYSEAINAETEACLNEATLAIGAVIDNINKSI